MPGQASDTLRSFSVLVAEDEYTIADELAELLEARVGELLGPVASLDEAMRLATSASRIDLAILDVNLQGRKVWPVVDALQARGVRMLLTTGYDADAIPPGYAHLPRCEKPASGDEMVRALARVLRSPPPGP